MKRTINNLAPLLVIVSALGTSPLHGQTAQSGDNGSDPTRIKLSNVVHINLGPTTVDTVMTALSTQTGLTIKAADYLRERKLIVRMDNLSGSAALDALSELNDWSWYRTNPNQILVTRRRLRLDSTPASIPRMIQAAIPRDLRTYLNIRTPNDDMSTYVNPLSLAVDPRQSDHNKLLRTEAMDKSAFLKSLAPQIFSAKSISYSKLDEKQRFGLVASLVFPVLSQTDDRLLHTDILPYVADLNGAVLYIRGETTLMVGSELIFPNGRSGAALGFQIR